MVGLQECVGDGAMEALSREKYEFVGAAAAHRGYVHLYVKRGVRWAGGRVLKGVAAVAAEVELAGQVVCVAAAHLAPGAEGAGQRRTEMRALVEAAQGGAVMLLGGIRSRPTGSPSRPPSA